MLAKRDLVATAVLAQMIASAAAKKKESRIIFLRGLLRKLRA